VGTVFVRNGVLWLNFKDADGRRRQLTTGLPQGQEKQAQALLTETEARIAKGLEQPSVQTVATQLDAWEARRQAEGVSMAKDDARSIKNHCSELLELPLAEVRPRHVRDVVSRLKSSMGPGADDLAPKTVRKVYGALHTFFEAAVAEELLPANPCNLPRGYLPKKLDKHPEWRAQAVFTRTEARALISEPLDLFDRLTWAAVLFTGMRTGEVSALRWRHLELDLKPLGRMMVAASWSRKEQREKPTKTGETRLAPIHPALASLLRLWKLKGYFEHTGRHPGADDLVFPTREGDHINEQPRFERLHKNLEQLGLRTHAGPERLRVHDLRRTFITLAQEDGGLPNSVRSITHTGKRDMIDLYTSLPWEAKCAAVASLRLEPLPAGGAQVLQLAGGQSRPSVTEAVTEDRWPPSPAPATHQAYGGLSSISGVPKEGFEPSRLAAPAPQAGVSTSSTTWAIHEVKNVDGALPEPLTSATAFVGLDGPYFCGFSAGSLLAGTESMAFGPSGATVGAGGAGSPVFTVAASASFALASASAFALSASCCCLVTSDEPCTTERLSPTSDSPSEVEKKATAQTAVSLPRKVTAPRPPKAVVAAPPPSAEPMPASFPGCSRMTRIMKTHSRT